MRRQTKVQADSVALLLKLILPLDRRLAIVPEYCCKDVSILKICGDKDGSDVKKAKEEVQCFGQFFFFFSLSWFSTNQYLLNLRLFQRLHRTMERYFNRAHSDDSHSAHRLSFGREYLNPPSRSTC